MNIWLIQTGEPLPLKEGVRKMRTALLADKLLERGHSVLWWASAFDHTSKQWIAEQDTELAIKEKFVIKILKSIGYKKNISFNRFLNNRIIAWKFKKMAPKMPRPDIIVVSMPSHDLAYQAVYFAHKNHIPVVVDIRDEWPDEFLIFLPKIIRRIAKLFIFNDFLMSRRTMVMADALVSMMETLLEWGLKKSGRQQDWQDKVFYLGYKKNIESEYIPDKISKITDVLKNKFVITFIGTLGNTNDPSILFDCAKKISQKDIQFVIAGGGNLFEAIKTRATQYSNFLILDWLKQDEMDALLKYSHLGLCPITRIRNVFPNKTFAYFSAGLPVLSAYQGDLKKIIKERQIGCYYPPNDADELSNCIKTLYNNRDLYEKMRQNAREVFDEMFDADKIYTKYAEHIEKIYVNFCAKK
ncbi:MAG: glycosyltransferase family 4 protein [Patescibacteria group bacterium]|nr:glycosyltransferase family 4 protein [Patescibacteria group bacterium]